MKRRSSRYEDGVFGVRTRRRLRGHAKRASAVDGYGHVLRRESHHAGHEVPPVRRAPAAPSSRVACETVSVTDSLRPPPSSSLQQQQQQQQQPQKPPPPPLPPPAIPEKKFKDSRTVAGQAATSIQLPTWIMDDRRLWTLKIHTTSRSSRVSRALPPDTEHRSRLNIAPQVERGKPRAHISFPLASE